MRFRAFLLVFGIIALIGFSTGCETKSEAAPLSDEAMKERAEELAQNFIITDGHIDIPYRLNKRMEDISQQTPGGDFDYVRAKAGGLNAPFMSIFIPASYQKTGGAKEFADSLIDMVYGFQEAWPDKFAVASSVADVHAQFAEGKVSLPMGMENGAPIEGKMENLRHFYDRGVRYITLTHSKANHICDSSYDENKKWNGLSPFGEELVAEMNRIGMMIDISHVSDSTFYDVLALTKAPLIASHSSCRKFTPDWERNMNDEMIKKLAENGGVICINFGSAFLRSEYTSSGTTARMAMNAYMKKHQISEDSEEAIAYRTKYRRENPFGTIEDVLVHIDHVVEIAGVDAVAFGSDYDGVFALPKGLQDVGEYPNLIYELLKRGYSESDIEKMCGGNMLRVWSAVEKIAAAE